MEEQLADLQGQLDFAMSQARISPRAASIQVAKLEPQIIAVEEELVALPAIPELSAEEIGREAAEIAHWMREQTELLRKAEPGVVKQFLRAVIRDLTIDFSKCEAMMELAIPEGAMALVGRLPMSPRPKWPCLAA